MRFTFPAATAALTLAASLTAQSPLLGPAGFAGGNGGSLGGAVYFDLTTAAASGIEVTAFDMHFSEAIGTAAGVDVYVRAGSHVGFESSPSGWALVASDDGTAVSAGANAPSSVPLAAPFCIPAGSTFGVALVAGPLVAHDYTNGNGTNQTASNADLTFTGGAGSNVPFSGSPFSPRVANINIYYNLSSCTGPYFPAQIVGAAETTAGSGTLSGANQKFTDGDFLRWNFSDPAGSNTNFFGAVVGNVGLGGAPAIGVTPQISGFDQLWAGSMPMGVAEIWGPGIVGAPDFIAQIPANLFNPGDTIRIQGLLLNAAVTGPFPVSPTSNTIEFEHAVIVACLEDFESVPTGVGSYPFGWSTDPASNYPWRAQTGPTGSANTGPSAGAFSGAVYMYCETSSPTAQGETFIMNTPAFPSAGLTTLSFQLSRVGTAIGDLEVRLDDGTGTFPTVLATYSGASTTGLDWDAETITLPATLPANVQIQFLYRAGPAVGGSGSTFSGDLAIDDFCLN